MLECSVAECCIVSCCSVSPMASRGPGERQRVRVPEGQLRCHRVECSTDHAVYAVTSHAYCGWCEFFSCPVPWGYSVCYAHCLSIVFRFDFYVAVLLAVEGASRWPMLRTFPLLLSQHWSERGLLSQHRRVREDHSASHTFTSRSAALRGCHSSCTGID